MSTIPAIGSEGYDDYALRLATIFGDGLPSQIRNEEWRVERGHTSPECLNALKRGQFLLVTASGDKRGHHTRTTTHAEDTEATTTEETL